jgi:hypothetical protein
MNDVKHIRFFLDGFQVANIKVCEQLDYHKINIQIEFTDGYTRNEEILI